MAPCNSNIALGRIEKIKKNQIVNPGSSPYNQMPQQSDQSDGTTVAPLLPAEDITDVITPNVETRSGGNQSSDSGSSGTAAAPEVLPDAPTFRVPANPLLPGGYQEVLDYNAVQYVNGFYRTQIGRYVKVEQLMGSNTIDTQEGFLIGVGINYILLQEAPTGNVLVVDIYGIKNMYLYYNYRPNPFEPFSVSAPGASGNTTSQPPGISRPDSGQNQAGGQSLR